MDNKTKEIEKLATNQKFREWVLNPNPGVEEYWENWTKKNPDKVDVVNEARDLLFTYHLHQIQLTKEQVSDEFEKVKSAINVKKSRRMIITKIGIAASLLFLMTIGYLIFQSPAFKYNYNTTYGEKRDIILPDDSKVILNANSSIKYNDWAQDREVWLKGEAFFDVQEQYTSDLEKVKFIVHTDNLDIEVVGTEFNVFQRENKTEVVLNKGKIRLKLKNHDKVKEVNMLPGDMVQYSKGSFIKKSVEPEDYASWLENRFVFEHTPLYEVAKKIESNYGLTVIFNDKQISNRKISGTVPTDNLGILIRALSKTFDIEIIQKDDKLIFKSK